MKEAYDVNFNWFIKLLSSYRNIFSRSSCDNFHFLFPYLAPIKGKCRVLFWKRCKWKYAEKYCLSFFSVVSFAVILTVTFPNSGISTLYLNIPWNIVNSYIIWKFFFIPIFITVCYINFIIFCCKEFNTRFLNNVSYPNFSW